MLIATVVIALLYLALVRVIDLNEKEPLWAVALLFALGAVAAALLLLLLPPVLLELTVLSGVLAKELARFFAVGLGVAVLVAVGRVRGWSEINGAMDGVVYGAAGGLGFATGSSLVHAFGASHELAAGLGAVTVQGHGELALAGLADGLFGALVGIGFAVALEARAPLVRLFAPAAGYLAAALAHLGYEELARGASLEDGALARKWAALALPLAAVVVTALVALRSERRAIAEELASEHETGAVDAAELALLRAVLARQASYLALLVRGAFAREASLRSLHSRQVQLALTKRRASREPNAARRLELGAEVMCLRRAVLVQKRALGLLVAESEP